MENDTAVVIEENQLYIKKAREEAKAYLFKNMEDVCQKIQLTEGEVLGVFGVNFIEN